MINHEGLKEGKDIFKSDFPQRHLDTKKAVFLKWNFFVSFLSAFTLCKENLETLEAISYMAASLGVLPSDFTYAGIKDKRAITYQSMVVKKVPPQR